jgi:type II secretory pathway pseudopilin PulG
VTAARSEGGTTLLEVLVALLLVAIGTLSIVPMFVSSLDVGAAGADIGSLNARATARMEALRAAAFHQLSPGGSLTSDVAGYSDTSDPEIVVRWKIIDGGGPPGSRTIRLIAFATSQLPGQMRSVELTTLRSR